MHVNVTFQSVKIKQLLGFTLRKWLHLEGSGHMVRLPYRSSPAGGAAQGFSDNAAVLRRMGKSINTRVNFPRWNLERSH